MFGYYEEKTKSAILSLLIAMLGLLLNQTSIIFGVNFSFGDILLLLLFMNLCFNKKLILPLKHTIFFLILSVSVLFSAAFLVKIRFDVTPNNAVILKDYIKLSVVFLYLILGYNLEARKYSEQMLKWFSGGAVLIGAIGIIFTVLDINIFRDMLFIGRTRFQGLMSDPNYFSTLQVVALAYYNGDKNIKSKYKYIYMSILSGSVLVSGSKTGMICLIVYSIFTVIEKLITCKKNMKKILIFIFLGLLTLVVMGLVREKMQQLVEGLADIIPTLDRVLILFTDFNEAIAGSGSGRDITWGTAIELIKLAPIAGVGVGTYIAITNKLWGVPVLAHNTYLQIGAEWGIPLAIIFFGYIALKIFNITISRRNNRDIILRDIIIIFLIASLAISLNNARIFWLILGAIIYRSYEFKTLFKGVKDGKDK